MTNEHGASRLGRGLAALIGDVETEEVQVLDRARHQRRVPIEFLRANPRNPRRSFGEDDLADLAASIREKGIVQPVIVRPVNGAPERFEIIAGERRWRAAQRAGLHEVPVVVHQVDDRGALEIAIIENVQRADLNPLEEAEGYERLAEEFGYQPVKIATMIGKSRSHIVNTMRLQKLPEEVKTLLRDGRLTAGHARALITHPEPQALARAIVDNELNVRETEVLAKERDPQAAVRRRAVAEKDADTRALEKRLADSLGLRVEIRHRANGRGEIRIAYSDVDQLEAVTNRLED